MNTFGSIKTKIEKASISLYGKPEFKSFLNQFKFIVLEDKDLSELYYIYDELSKEKGMKKDIVEDYVNESIEYSQILIESNKKTLDKVNYWISSIVLEESNNYKDIDNTIYSSSIKNLESVLESKNKIKKILISESKKLNESSHTSNLPISSMVKIANQTLNNEFSNLNESDKVELNSILSLSIDEVKTEMMELKENVINDLKSTLNESKDLQLDETIESTIKKINESKVDHYNLYKLRKLNLGL
jgi:hypothetical protein